MTDFCFYIDGDSCPSEIRKIVEEKAVLLNRHLTIAANREIPFAFENKLFTMHVCPNEISSADEFIVENANPCDIVITKDLILAKRLLEKNVNVLNDRGTKFDRDNIEYYLEERELSLQMSALGLKKGCNFRSFGKKEIAAFTECLEKILSQI